MSLFNWFSRKPAASQPPSLSSGLSRQDATMPAMSPRHRAQRKTADKTRVRVQAPQGEPVPSARKTERLLRRELLYQVVREAMLRVGLLSASYKFKVLSLDQRGRQFLVMIDVAREFGSQSARLAEIEALIAQSAKARNDTVVTAVYWRLHEHVAIGKPQARNGGVATHPMPLMQASPMAIPMRTAPRHDPLEEEEVLAFRRALAAATAPHGGTSARGQSNYTLLTGYEDTEVANSDDALPVLSGTQYGELR